MCWEHGERVGGSRLRHATRARCHRRLQLVPPEHDVVSRAQPSTSWTAAPAPADQRSSSGRYGPAVLRRRDQVSACGVVRVGLSRRLERRRIDSKLTFRGGGRYCTLDRSTRIWLGAACTRNGIPGWAANRWAISRSAVQSLRESVSPGLFRPLFGVLRPTLSTDQDGGPRSDLVVGSCCPRPGVGVQCQQRVRGSTTTASRDRVQQSR